ncbi:auxilin, putative [Ricinus communis]|uniref:Auxilin, putative n=1 Tax=Ricinus communis TaxID=3988 RepID=B9S2V1_RICCO|nr:auxilin, putative [Ricinus communis]
MDEFGDLTKHYGLRPQGKSAPMASSKGPNIPTNARTRNSISNSSLNPKSTNNSSSGNGSFFNDNETLFVSKHSSQNFNVLDDVNDGFDIFGGFQKNSNTNGNGSSLNYDPFFSTSNYSSAKSSFDGDILSGLNGSNSNNNTDDLFGSFVSKPNQSALVDDLLGGFGATLKPSSQNGSVGFDDLLPGFGNVSINSFNKRENTGMNSSTYTSTDDPFVVLESTSTTTKSTSANPLEEVSLFSHSGSTKRGGSSNVPSLLRPPPKPGQVLRSDKVKSSNVSFIDELEEFGMVRSNVDGHSNAHHAKEARERETAKANRYKEAEDANRKNQQTSMDDIESILNMGSRSSSAPKSRAATLGPVFDAKSNNRGEPAVAQKKSGSASSGIRKASSTTSIVDEFSFMFGGKCYCNWLFLE